MGSKISFLDNSTVTVVFLNSCWDVSGVENTFQQPNSNSVVFVVEQKFLKNVS